MENQEQTAQLEKPKLKIAKILTGAVILAVILILIVILMPFWRGRELPEQTEGIYTGAVGERINACLYKESLGEECRLLFSSPGILEECKKLENNKDKCFYKTAITSFRLEACELISNKSLKSECIMVIPTNRGL